MATHDSPFTACDTSSDDVCLIAFTSGTTGVPTGCMHFHRDVLAMCDGFSAQVLGLSAIDRCIGTPPLAFTFGLGGLLAFPMPGTGPRPVHPTRRGQADRPNGPARLRGSDAAPGW
jgi:2-aminobenzoate-CoA ligase